MMMAFACTSARTPTLTGAAAASAVAKRVTASASSARARLESVAVRAMVASSSRAEVRSGDVAPSAGPSIACARCTCATASLPTPRTSAA